MRKLVTQQGNTKPKHNARGGLKARLQREQIYVTVALSQNIGGGGGANDKKLSSENVKVKDIADYITGTLMPS